MKETAKSFLQRSIENSVQGIPRGTSESVRTHGVVHYFARKTGDSLHLTIRKNTEIDRRETCIDVNGLLYESRIDGISYRDERDLIRTLPVFGDQFGVPIGIAQPQVRDHGHESFEIDMADPSLRQLAVVAFKLFRAEMSLEPVMDMAD